MAFLTIIPYPYCQTISSQPKQAKKGEKPKESRLQTNLFALRGKGRFCACVCPYTEESGTTVGKEFACARSGRHTNADVFLLVFDLKFGAHWSVPKSVGKYSLPLLHSILFVWTLIWICLFSIRCVTRPVTCQIWRNRLHLHNALPLGVSKQHNLMLPPFFGNFLSFYSSPNIGHTLKNRSQARVTCRSLFKQPSFSHSDWLLSGFALGTHFLPNTIQSHSPANGFVQPGKVFQCLHFLNFSFLPSIFPFDAASFFPALHFSVDILHRQP